MPKHKTKWGRNKGFYLSNEAIAKLARLSSGNESAYLDALILREYNLNFPREADLERVKEEANEIVDSLAKDIVEEDKI